MTAVKIFFGMLPFFLFSLLSPIVGVGWAATVGLLAAVVVVAATSRGGIKELPAAQGVLLGVMAVIGFISDRSTDVVLIHYGPAIAALVLGLFIIATARTEPFNAQFARSSVAPEFWHSRRFLDVNRRISTAWGIAILFSSLCHLVAAQIGVERLALVLRLSLNQGVSLLGLLVAAAYTKRVADAAKQLAAKHSADGDRDGPSEPHDDRSAHGAHEARA